LYSDGYLNNPCVGQKGPKVKRALPKTLSPDSCAQLLDGKKEQDIDSNVLLARDHAMFELRRAVPVLDSEPG